MTKTVVLLAGLAAGFGASAQVQVPSVQSAAGSVPAGSVTGMAALRMIEDRLDAVAAEYHLEPVELATMLRTGTSVYITPEGRMINVCPVAPEEASDPDLGAIVPAFADIPLDDFLSLQSNPGATKTIYLDFTGHHSVSNSWNHNIMFPPYDTNGNTGVFSDQEKADIIKHWLEVVEDFAPYNVNVTTADPGTAALIRSGGGDQNYGIRCVMTQQTSGFGNGIGGVAFLNSFDDSIDNPCFGFNKGLGAGPMTASHEVGHTLGLSHDGLNSQSYHPGSGGGQPSWGPIMGAPFNAQLVQWSNGDYDGATTSQNDTGIITNGANGITTFADDHSDSFLSGTPFDIAEGASGVLHSRTDVDAHTFTVAEDRQYTISVLNAEVGPNVDVKYDLYSNSPVALIDTFDVLTTADAVRITDLVAGSYTLVVDGSFRPSGRGPVSDYGSFGQYTVGVAPYTPPAQPSVSFPEGLPTQFSDAEPTEILINIDPGSFTLDTNDITMTYGLGVPFPFNPVDLVPAGDNNYTASIPAGACDQSVVFNFQIGMLDIADFFSPAKELDVYSGTVVCAEPECVADTNGDGSLTPADFGAWVSAFNAQSPACDQNGDSLCTPADFGAWITNFNAGCP